MDPTIQRGDIEGRDRIKYWRQCGVEILKCDVHAYVNELAHHLSTNGSIRVAPGSFVKVAPRNVKEEPDAEEEADRAPKKDQGSRQTEAS